MEDSAQSRIGAFKNLGDRLKRLDWDDFRLFVAVARIGSFTRAARELHVSEPTVSRRMKRLESTLGARLFDRGKGASQLTAEGKRVLNYATAAEHSLSRAAAATREATRQVAGDCNLIMGDGLGCYWLPPFLASFFKHNPAVDLRLFTSHALATDQTPPFDIQIHYTHPSLAPESVAIRVATLHFTLFAVPEYIEQFGIPRTLQDLRDHKVADSAFRLTERGSLMSWANLNHDLAVMTNSSIVLAETVRKGASLGLLPTYSWLIDQRLKAVMPETHFAAPIFVCFEREIGTKPAVRTTIEYLKRFVFDSKQMPWFFDHFVVPEKSWKRIYDDCLARASADRDG